MKIELHLESEKITQKVAKDFIPYYEIYFNRAKSFFDKFNVSQSGYTTSKGFLIITFINDDVSEQCECKGKSKKPKK